MFRLSQFAAPAALGIVLALGGCAHDHPSDIPVTAQEIGEAKESVFYNAPHDGTVYVYDDTANKMVYSGKLDKGQMIKVDAKENKVLVDGRTAVKTDLVNDHRYRIYFDRDERDRDAAHAERTTIITPPAAPASGQQTTIVTDPNARTSVTTDPDAAQPARTTITSDPDTGRTTVKTAPSAAPQPGQTTVTTDPDTGRTTVKTAPAR
jgi:hypothetical protein